jgi:hypothetical protein
MTHTCHIPRQELNQAAGFSPITHVHSFLDKAQHIISLAVFRS